jgi:hypothetical protein
VRGASVNVVCIDEVQDYPNKNGDIFPGIVTYEDYYQLKIVGPVPDFLDIDWYYTAKCEEAPCGREPFEPPRKGRRGWNQPTPHHHLRQHRPRMNYKRRSRHG